MLDNQKEKNHINMQSDEVIWEIINNNFCSYKVKTNTGAFCRNEYNVSGLCNRQSCPLANSRYATVRHANGNLYLCMKTVERAHTPAKLWERIKLPKNYSEALSLIDEQLKYWPKFQIHKCKQRLTKLTQYLIKMRKIALKADPKLIPIRKKIERRENRREMKAEAAARIEQTIEKELLSRLKAGTYGEMYNDIVNIDSNAFEEAMDNIEVEQETEMAGFIEDESEDGLENLEYESDDMEDLDELDMSSLNEDSEVSDSDFGSDVDENTGKGGQKRKKKGPRIEIEYEQEPTMSGKITSL